MALKTNHINALGILGGGQLSQMLAEASTAMGYLPVILAENSECPAAQTCPNVIYGALNHPAALESLFSQVNQVIFENEFVDCSALKEAAAKWDIQFFPPLESIALLQDKLRQKKLLQELGIPTSDYFELDLNTGLEDQFRKVSREFPQFFKDGCVLKWSRMGYDGKGVLILNSLQSTLAGDTLEWVKSFCEKARQANSSVYVEQKVSFKRELAMIGVYSTRKEFLNYPLVVSEQRRGICYRVYGPATAFGVSGTVETQAKEYLRKIAQAVDLFGAFGVEFFETQTGALIVNEIAPRVHNSGHYTQNACATSQFENHWRAILGLELGVVDTASGFVMLNVLGPEFPTLSGILKVLPKPGSREHLHWYRKKEIRPHRKLGHLNGIIQMPPVGRQLPHPPQLSQAIEGLIQEIDQTYQEWVSQIS